MKRITAYLAGIVCLLAIGACSRQAQPRVVEAPYITATNTENLDIASIDLNDSATVVTFHARFRPNWWISIAAESYLSVDGKQYPIVSAQGITPGEQFTLPESGEAEFTITFEPVPLDAKTIDFSEGMAGGWQLLGIDVTGKKAEYAPELNAALPKEIRNLNLTEVFAEPVMEVAPTVLRFHVLDYRPEYGNKLEGMFANFGITENLSVNLDENGEGTLETVLYGPTEVNIRLSDLLPITYNSIIVAPGTDTDIYLDPALTADVVLSARDKNPRPVRNRAFDNGRYAALNRVKADHAEDLALQASTLPGYSWRVTPDQFTDLVLERRAALMDTLGSFNLPEAASSYLAAMIDAQALNDMATAGYTLRSSYYTEKGTPEGMNDSIKGIPGEEQYKRFSASVDAANPMLLFMPWMGNAVAVDWGEYGAKTAQPTEMRNYVIAARKAKGGKLTDAQLEPLKDASSPFFTQAATTLQAETEKKIEAMKKQIEANPEVPNEQLFEAIVAPYKGKVVLVDLWNTWCGPCRNALKANEPLKTDELSDPDIVWLYIADESSDPVQYGEMIPGIKGVHHLVSADQIQTIRKQFEVDGIPYYILVDREGKATGHPDFRDHSKLIEGVKSAL